MRVQGAVIRVRAGRGESMGELLATVQAGGNEAPIVRRDGVGVVASIDPDDRCADWDGHRTKTELNPRDGGARSLRRCSGDRRRGAYRRVEGPTDTRAACRGERNEHHSAPLPHDVASLVFDALTYANDRRSDSFLAHEKKFGGVI